MSGKAKKTTKSKKTADIEESNVSESQQVEEQEQIAETKKTTRTRKKQPQVVAVVTPDGIQGSLAGTQRPLIAYLPVRTAQLEEQKILMKKTEGELVPEPQPFDEMDSGLSFLAGSGSQQTHESVPASATQHMEPIHEPENVDILPPPPSAQKSVWQKKDETVAASPMLREALGDVGSLRRGQLPCYYSEKLMVQYQDKNRMMRLPEKTDIHCFWDCHEFSGPPCVIPQGIQDGVWRVYGNFCSPSCAVSYLFSQRLDANEQWERYSMLNRLYHAFCASPTQGIKAAPSREVLRIFGGSLDISEYREMLIKPTIRIDVLTPPMVSIIQSMDTKPIDFYDAALKNVFIQNDENKLQKPGIMGLRLRRTKPIRDKENTLEFVMRSPEPVSRNEKSIAALF